MRLRRLTIVAIATVAATAAAACSNPLRPEDQLDFSVAVSRGAIGPNDSVTFSALVENQSATNLPIARPCGRLFEFEVVNGAGAVVLSTNGPGFPCATDTSSSTLTLRAQEARSASVSLLGLRSDGVALPSGAYSVRAVVRPVGQIRRSAAVGVTVP